MDDIDDIDVNWQNNSCFKGFQKQEYLVIHHYPCLVNQSFNIC